ncbi:RNase P modulator RnpM [Desulfuribacillus alkaliarsenatis]|uniref:YlxR domain-containing protein n=1 Tax=Desulfuribacillus alkaliarsenatis TaxID=766136 RepID=A0A1E5G7C5_9FIRM|nr:YlxR family protein [Desulfuribacillus alkaliarsenatis]OEF98644.1 hypothetical protein BHF68_02990 [Desulfuribacillus alkaliarsenatis]
MKKRKIPMRKCVGCQEMMPKKSLLRVVITPDDETHIDTTGKKSGRGSYVCYDEECLNKAMKNKGLEKSLKAKINKEMYETIDYSIKRYNLLNKGNNEI